MEKKETAVVKTLVNELSTHDVLHQVGHIQELIKEVMKEGEHFGKIPGCGDKLVLLKPGAEKLNLTFRLSPTYEKIIKTDLPNGHREYEIVCTLTHIPTGQILGQGLGLCTTMESKYRYRTGERKCPKCGKATIIKGKQEYGGGWLCYIKKGGCGTKFADGDKSIEDQQIGKVENLNPADEFNTVLKMAKKRAHVDAILTVTAASDIFTQDIESELNNGKPTQKAEKESVFNNIIGDSKTIGFQGWTDICKLAKNCKNPDGKPFGIARLVNRCIEKDEFGISGSALTIKQREIIEEWFRQWENGTYSEKNKTIEV